MGSLSVVVLSVVCVASGSALSLVPAPDRCLPYPCALPPQDWVYPWCKHQCTVDRDCGLGGLCCQGCGCRVCQRGFPVDTCKTKVCPPGQVCVDTPVLCKRLPCPQRDQTRCEPISTKPGSCPQWRCLQPLNPACKDTCKTDSNCKGNMKCCTDCTGCRNCHTPWGIPITGCENVLCPVGEVCVASPKPHCECKAGLVNCFVAPCRFARCDNHPGAQCSDDYCGGCRAVWRLNGRILNDCRALGGPRLEAEADS